MSRRSVPLSGWQRGMPQDGYWEQPCHPMNYGPMWAGQSNMPFMGGNMPPDMMLFGGNVPPRSYFRRSFDQPPHRYRACQGFCDYHGNWQEYRRGDRKRPGPSYRSRSPASKRATQRRDGARRAEEESREGASEGETAATEEEATEDGAAQVGYLDDPAETSTEETVEGAQVAEGQEGASGDVNQEAGNEDNGQEAGSSADKDGMVKRDEKYPKCHACKMGFNNPKQYEHHCAGDLHRKNVEVLDDEVDETAGPLGEEYLQEVRAYYCTLCKLLLKVDLKSHHCSTQGHYRRHRDLKLKEEATKKAKRAKEKAEEEQDYTNQETYTITDEVGSDDEARAASDAAGYGVDVLHDYVLGSMRLNMHCGLFYEAVKELVNRSGMWLMKHSRKSQWRQLEGDHDVEEPEASEDNVDPLEGEGDNEQHAQQEEEEREDASELEAASAAASLLDEPKESDAADRNGCKGPEEDVAEENPAVVAPATTAARAAATSAATAGAPKATVSKLPPPKVVVKKVPAAKATVAVTKPSATAAKVPLLRQALRQTQLPRPLVHPLVLRLPKHQLHP
ncbi:hypothetical protein HPB50_016130 [Hyalomma asiaticum]|uniref:Uncharacterized protein n=1 Tax=Hyalomma asiaticum TaxID=266040 RepID=A0ACB7TL92_HYAAI|nr:hypothetical protein HPB50_016130 [Hyalomma asiaticum]